MPITRTVIAVLFILLIFSGCARPLVGLSTLAAQLDRDKAPEAFMGIGFRPLKELPQIEYTRKASCGIEVVRVIADSPAFYAGIRARDIIIGIDNYFFDVPSEKIRERFLDVLRLHQPGDNIRLEVIRLLDSTRVVVDGVTIHESIHPGELPRLIKDTLTGSKVETSTLNKWVKKQFSFTLDKHTKYKYPPLPDIRDSDLGKVLFADEDSPRLLWEERVEEAVNRYELSSQYDNLRQRLADIESGDDGYRLPVVAAVHRNPLLIEDVGRFLTDHLMADRENHVSDPFNFENIHLLLTARKSVSDDFEFLPVPVHGGSKDLEKWFNGQLSILVNELLKTYARLDDEEKEFLMSHGFDLTHVFIDEIYIGADENEDRLSRNLRTIQLGKKINQKALCNAAKAAYYFIIRSKKQIFQWMETHPDVRSIETKWGKIGLGSPARDRWDDPDFKFIYDPGGDDFYADGTGVADSFEKPISWIVDKGGNDAYQSTSEGAQGSGLFGVGILVDLAGHDTYIAQQWAQGTGMMGMGILVDRKGNDIYRAWEFSQGSGLFGWGILADIEGNDRYEATANSQGVGFTNGLGILMDYSGNDYGYCSGKQATGYGTPGIFDAWSQGCGMGFRGIASGGIGIVVDAEGKDQWEAGNFSQGGGYYYGMGIFRSGGEGDDTFIASRYGQGFSAHQAIGIFIEDGGNDYYTTRHAVVTGLAWDQSVSLFIDESGDDFYNGGDFVSHGASAHNSMCFFLDKSGRDEYHYKEGPGRAEGNRYHGGSSLSLFLDMGDEIDLYTCDDVQNDMECLWPGFGLFKDGND